MVEHIEWKCSVQKPYLCFALFQSYCSLILFMPPASTDAGAYSDCPVRLYVRLSVRTKNYSVIRLKYLYKLLSFSFK